MLGSLALIFIAGLFMAYLCQLLKLPRIIGMLLTGILLGPGCLNYLDGKLLDISAELRQIALIMILIKAGLSLKLSDLKQVGRPALLMSFIPALCEVLAFTLFAPLLLPVNRMEAAVMGAVLGAVSPAVVVPRMVQLIEQHRGTAKSIPQLILAGASLDDVFVIVLFSTFLGMAQGEGFNGWQLTRIPVSILLGIALGAAAGFLLAFLFEQAHSKGHSIRNSHKLIILLAAAFLLMTIEKMLNEQLPVSGLLAVTSMACTLAMRSRPAVIADLSQKTG